MKVVPKIKFTKGARCRQVYNFLVSKNFDTEARALDRSFIWEEASIADIKKFFKKMYLPSQTKQIVFLILNNKACYFESLFDMPYNIAYSDEDKYTGLHLLEGEI